MSPTATSPYSVDHLISKRAAGRNVSHFTSFDTSSAPENFKPHPDPMPLSFGRPNEQYIPIKKITVELDNYPFQDSLFASEEEHTGVISMDRYPEHKGIVGTGEAFQYCELQGIPAFYNLLKNFVATVHKPGYNDWDVIPTNGSGDGLNKAADVVLDRDDIVLMEEFSFTPFKNCALNVGGIPVPIRLNFNSASADVDVAYLQELLENWDELRPEFKGRKPKALYTIPTCQNPTGLTQSVETRKKIYELASIHDFLIIEDDPYGYLTLPEYQPPDSENIKDLDISVDDYINNELYPSYLQFDTQGRVIRLETFSKIFAPGLRLGFIVGHQNVIKAIKKYTGLMTRAPAGVSQMLVVNIIDKQFGGIKGYLGWFLKMRLAYAHRRNVLIHSLVTSKAFEKNYFRIIASKNGMFANVGINFPEGVDKTEKLTQLNYKFLEKGVLVVLGFKMAVDQQFSKDNSNFLRISFAPLDNDELLAEAGKRLSDAIYEFFENGLKY